MHLTNPERKRGDRSAENTQACAEPGEARKEVGYTIMRSMRSNEIAATVVLLLGFSAVAFAVYICCNRRPLVAVEFDAHNEPPTILLRSHLIGHNPMIDVYTASNLDRLWFASLENDFFTQHDYRFVYGVVPENGKQFFPVAGVRARELIDGELLYVVIRFQYDSFLSANMSSKGFEVRYNKKGKSIVTPVEHRRLPD